MIHFSELRDFHLRKALTNMEKTLRLLPFLILVSFLACFAVSRGAGAWVYVLCLAVTLAAGAAVPFVRIGRKVEVQASVEGEAGLREDGLYIAYRFHDPEQEMEFPFLSDYEEKIFFPWNDVFQYARTEEGLPLLGKAVTDCLLCGRRLKRTGARCVIVPDVDGFADRVAERLKARPCIESPWPPLENGEA